MSDSSPKYSRGGEGQRQGEVPQSAVEARQPGPQRGGGHGAHGHGGMIPVAKAKNFKAALAQFFRYLGRQRIAMIIAVVFAVFGTVLGVIGPKYLGDMTDIITNGLVDTMDLNAVLDILALLVGLYAAGAVFSYVQGFIMATVTGRVSKKMRTNLSAKINRIPLNYFDTHLTGDTLSRITNDVDTVGNSLNQSVTMLITAVVMLVGTVIMMFVVNWMLALVAIASSLGGFFLMGFIMKRSQKYFVTQQRNLGEINGHIEEVYSGLNIVRVSNAGERVRARFAAQNGELKRNAERSQFLSSAMMPIMIFIGNLGYVLVCVVGAVLVINEQIEIGVIASFMIYVRLFTQPFGQIAQAGSSVQAIAAASERVFEFLNEDELADESGKALQLRDVAGAVEFRNVRFGYSPDKIIINDFSAAIKAGSKVAIVGPTGAGKTTLVNLLMRFYEVAGGEILIDGVSTSDISRENVHGLFGMVLQDTWVFEGTVADNVRYAKDGVTDEQVAAACRAANLEHFIHTLPDGYNTVVNEKLSLSAGQRQLLTIARAMVEDAPMLILDEATSSVDTRTEILIQEAMDRLTAERTTFVIAHRLSTVRNADLILVLKDGDIVESGNHDTLLAAGGFYESLYNSQF